MSPKTLIALIFCFILTFSVNIASAQSRTVTGKVTDSKDGSPVVGASVQVVGSKGGTSTKPDGTFSLSVSSGATDLLITSVGFEDQKVPITGKSNVDVSLVASTGSSMNEVVVVGYGSSRKRDLTGSVGSVKAKEFNQGPVTNPDQLLIGKVAGLQIINTSGQPGAATIVKIRGNNSIRSGNSPLYVIDGIPLDGRSARPGANVAGLGQTPDANPLIFINPADISSIDILKDASAAAIYGSRGANGVVLITTRKGTGGPTKIDVGSSIGFAGVMRKIKVLDAAGYKAALATYGAPNTDGGVSIDPFKEIIHKGATSQNYSVAFSGGNDNGKYRASFLYANQQGIIRKSGLKKYVANFNSQNKFLDKKLSIDFNVTAANVGERIAPISNDAGSAGNIISLALIWNPTRSLTLPNGLYDQANPSGQVNPLALSDAYNDLTSITTLLANTAIGYKITPDLEYKLLYGVNYSTGNRKIELQGWIQALGAPAGGTGIVLNSQLFSQTVTHTLNYDKKITQKLNMNVLAGYEYWKTIYLGSGTRGTNFNLNQAQNNITPNYHYYDNLQGSSQGNLATYAFRDPSVEIQSYFARAVFNYDDKFLLTGTFRADGSSKFGSNNKYAYFPSVAAAWNITNMGFMKSNKLFNTLKLRLGYGKTGNQEFNPVDAALQTATYVGFSNLQVNHYGNPDLKWESVTSVDAGLDFNILKNRVWGFIDYFSKKTTDPIVEFPISQPTGGGGTVFSNMDGVSRQKGTITNKGLEVSVGAAIIEKKNLVWNVSANITFVKNKFEAPALSSIPFFKNTGALNGQGTSQAYAEVIAHGQPIDVFYLREFKGFDKSTGQAIYGANPVFSGDPNPNTFLGFSTDVTWKKFNLGLNFHGNFGNLIYNNTDMSVLNISNIQGGRNIGSQLVGNGENKTNPITPSTRFLEKGDFVKLGNATISYKIGNLGKFVKNANVYISGSNLFVISKYKGFDPEVNVDKSLNGIPSLGIDYIGYPTSRTFIFGLNFSL
jgi:iron complex outermembrane receptor protein